MRPSSSLGRRREGQSRRTLRPVGVPLKDLVNELDASSALALRLADDLGVTSLLLLNCEPREKRKAKGQLSSHRGEG
jgi:hypothetical protein